MEIPDQGATWVGAVKSKWLFLLLVNVFLLGVGCLMDIYSAIVVVVPLLVPMAQVFGVDMTHLGVIFLVNLQLGYLTPPVGMNLFLASYRFDKPVGEVTRAALPMLAVLLIGVLLITYLPWLTTWLPGIWNNNSGTRQSNPHLQSETTLSEERGCNSTMFEPVPGNFCGRRLARNGERDVYCSG